MTRSRFFSHSDDGADTSGSAARAPRSTKMAAGGCGGSGTGGTSSRWRRPRLRRSHAHDFSEALLSGKAEKITPALSGDSLGSGYTEAPSSRGTSTASLSTCSPALGSVEDGALDVEDFDLDGGDELSWLEEDLAPAVVLPGTAASAAVLEEEDDEFAVEHKPQRFTGPLVLHVQDFECGECIGKGSYSKVFLGTHALTGTEWALKVVSKRKTFETRENLAHLREERYISTKLQGSDFLVRTAGTFNTTRSVVFAMEYLPGGDLYQRLSDKGTLSLGEAVAWTAQAVLAIEDLHAKNIVHRDVKPENFLMGKSGTLKLTDFGFARELEPDERLYSQFGTPEYVAPEVLNGCGHGMPVDLWALGVLIYELLVGQTPFKSPSVDEMYERIAAGDYAFPAPPAPRTPRSRRAATPPATSAAAPGGFAKPSSKASVPNPAKSGCSLPGGPTCAGGGAAPRKKAPAALPGGVAMSVDTTNHSSSSSSSGGGFGGSRSAQSQARDHQQPAQLEKLGHQPHKQPKQQQQQQWRSETSNSSTCAVAEHPAPRDPSSSKYFTAPPPAPGSHHRKSSSSSLSGGGGGAHDPAAQSLVNALLCLSPSRRPSIDEVKQHPFFAGVDFEGLRAAVRAQADREEEDAMVAAAIDGDGEVWVRGQPVECVSEDVEDNYGGVFAGF